MKISNFKKYFIIIVFIIIFLLICYVMTNPNNIILYDIF